VKERTTPLSSAAELTKPAIRRLVGRPDSLVVEVGAADGVDSLEFLREFKSPNFRILCIEPDPRNIATFQSQVRDSRATLIQAAIGAETGDAVFYQSSTIYSSSLKQPNLDEINRQWPDIKFPDTLQVSTFTLDDLLGREVSRVVDFLWADVQGAEDLLIGGGQEALNGQVRFFYTEYSPNQYYMNEPNLKDIREALGPRWHLLRDFGTDALFAWDGD